MASSIVSSEARNASQLSHANAVGVLDEWRGEIDKIHAVASAGRVYCGDDCPVLKSLFEVLEDLLSNAVLAIALREELDAWAAREQSSQVRA